MLYLAEAAILLFLNKNGVQNIIGLLELVVLKEVERERVVEWLPSPPNNSCGCTRRQASLGEATCKTDRGTGQVLSWKKFRRKYRRSSPGEKKSLHEARVTLPSGCSHFEHFVKGRRFPTSSKELRNVPPTFSSKRPRAGENDN